MSWEKLTYIFSALGTLFAVLYGVIAGTAYMKDYQHAFASIQEDVTHNRTILEDRSARFDVVEATQTNMLKGMLTLVYVTNDHVLVKTFDGKEVRIPLMHLLEDRLSKEDGRLIQHELDEIKKLAWQYRGS